MSDQQQPFPLRMPPELRESLERDAAAAGRSLNAEVLLRLHGGAGSLRDSFAAQAMAALIVSDSWNIEAAPGPDVSMHHVAEEAYAFADSMLEARRG